MSQAVADRDPQVGSLHPYLRESIVESNPSELVVVVEVGR